MRNILILVLLTSLISCHPKNDPAPALLIVDMYAGPVKLNLTAPETNINIPVDQLIRIDFSAPVDTAIVSASVSITQNGSLVPVKVSYYYSNQAVSIKPKQNLQHNLLYQFKLTNALKGKGGETFAGFTTSFTTIPATLALTSLKMSGVDVLSASLVQDIPLTPSIEFNFNAPVNPQTAIASNFVITGKNPGSINVALSNQDKTVTITTANALNQLDKYSISVSASLKGANGEVFTAYSKTFYTQVDATPKFPVVTDDQLLDLIQQQTLKYFYDFGHPVSGMARERDSSGDVVTTGGSGFGLMGMIAGIERNFISRADGIARFNKIVSFLETADRFHGAWPHWMNGSTGKVVPFGVNDNGADLVETSYMIQGLITVRQYLTQSDTVGNNLINRINALYQAVEWDWFRQNNQNVLYWNWSPDKGWAVNVPVRGYNETLITYLMAAASPTHSIPIEVYQQGWAQSGIIKNGKSFYGYVLPLGEDYGGPLFFTQYSFLGFNPHVTDPYLNVDFWTQNVNQSMINYSYCVANPQHYVGYNSDFWGLTASDNPTGYFAQSPTNDNGTITPTAAIASIPYTPTQSMNAIKYFYYTLGDKLWGPYGFYDAINVTSGWTASSTLAIDQGPIIVMIENYRTQLLWNLFMSAPEVQAGKTKLGFN